MKRIICVEGTTTATPTVRHLSLAVAALVSAVVCLPAAADNRGSDDYVQTNLVSDQPGVALLTDTNLVNAWGMSSSSSSPIWVSDNGSGLSTLYAVTYSNGLVSVAKLGLEVAIPGDGTPTGQLFNGTTGFHTNLFIFASEDGTISGWRGALGTTAEVLVPADTNNVYKGVTLASNGTAVVLLAANFRQGTLDEYDRNLNLVGQFADPKAPAGYAPFNVQTLDGVTFVTFAKQDPAKHDDVAGKGHGLIDIFNPQTSMFHRLVTGKDAGGKLMEINSPWGLAISPGTFGRHADQLLVGNFGSGTIMTFEANGYFQGLLEDANSREKPLVIDGLWGLKFGNDGRGGRSNTLYFTAGPDGESHGLFGAIDVAPDEPRHGNGQGEDHK